MIFERYVFIYLFRFSFCVRQPSSEIIATRRVTTSHQRTRHQLDQHLRNEEMLQVQRFHQGVSPHNRHALGGTARLRQPSETKVSFFPHRIRQAPDRRFRSKLFDDTIQAKTEFHWSS